MSQRPKTRRLAIVRRPLQPIRLQLHPFVAGGLGLGLLVLLGWSAATTTYALFRDEFLTQIVSRHSATERASSAEIVRLKADLQRVSSRALIAQENYSDQLDALSRRQAEAERRYEVLSQLGVAGEAGMPAEDSVESLITPDELRLSGRPIRESRATAGPAAALNARYDDLERRQERMIVAAQEQLGRDAVKLRGVYASLGLVPVAEEPAKAGLGGLYIPFGFGEGKENPELDPLQEAIEETARLRAGLDAIPLRSPAPGASFSSGFGNRPDPFLGTLAFHSGLDLAAAPGTAARVTASGTVVSAGWNGGYGLMVEVSHAHGYSTRYAHLSAISVSEGQELKAGDVVGRVGSTGRSTGPHLHYETRLNDVALDPRKMLAAGARLD